MLHHVPLLTLFAHAEFQGSMWALYATPEVLTSMNYLQYMRARTYFQRHDKSYVAHDMSMPDRASICRLCTHHIRNAHNNKKLGNWASAMQFGITYLPYDTHFSLTMIRGSSRLHQWDINVPPPDECIYAILHMHMICIYIGRTHLPLLQRLRKHITTANAHSEDCHLHQLLRSTNIEDWYIVPLELVWGKFRAAIAERYWWDQYRRLAINDIPPAVPNDDGKPAKRYLTGLFRCCVAFLLHVPTIILPEPRLYKRRPPLLLVR